jgi:hypothetical protein
MKRWIILGMGVVGLIIVGFVVWTEVVDSSSSPVQVTRLESEISYLHNDKSGTRRAKVAGRGEIALYQYLLEGGKKTRSSFDPRGTQIISIKAGKGLLQTARFGHKNELSWFDEIPIEEGDYFSIPPKIVYQLEATGEEPLHYLIFSSKGSQQKDREFLREEHLSSTPNKRRQLLASEAAEINGNAKTAQWDKNPGVVPNVLEVNTEGNGYSYESGELGLRNTIEVAGTMVDHNVNALSDP